MNKRVEAAVKAWDHHWGDRYGDEAMDEMGEEVKVALDAADAVLLSDEVVERAAAAAFFQDDMGGHVRGHWTYQTIPEEGRRNYRDMVRAVLTAALREES